MSGFALAVALVAAHLHALWNAMLKAHRARLSAFAAVVAGQAAVGLVASVWWRQSGCLFRIPTPGRDWRHRR